MEPTLYLKRLSERDLAFLADASGRRGAESVARMRADPVLIEEAMGSSEVFDAVFAPWAEHPFMLASPFLVFSVLLAGTERQLASTSFVREWIGPRQRIPVFDVDGLRNLLAEPLCRVFLADLLASYTHVVSGSVWVRDRRGWSRRRFSELDPLRLAALLDVVPPAEQVSVYRRLGDLALFLSGVFPDAAERLFHPVQLERLGRVLDDVTGSGDDEPPTVVATLERLGRASYAMVMRAIGDPRLETARGLATVTERFGDARRVLNVLTDTHLFPVRGEWFPGV